MPSASLSVGWPIAYRVPSLDLPGHVHQIEAELCDGEHVSSPQILSSELFTAWVATPWWAD